MKTEIKSLNGDTIKLESNRISDTAAPWANQSTHANFNNHKIKVTHNKKVLTFDFWASIANPEIKTEEELISAFNYFVSDATAGNNSFEDFCNEFGYDTDSRTAERTYKACVKSLNKFNKVFQNVDVFDMANYLQETFEI